MKKFANFIIRWLGNSKILSLPKKFAGNILLDYCSSKNGVLFFYNDTFSTRAFHLIKQIKKERDMLLSNIEAYQIYITVKKTEKISGDIAEVGVYKGASAKLICEAGGDKSIHLFDTFEGLPEISDKDDSERFHKGEYSVMLENVKNYLKSYPNVYFYKGIFPASADTAKNKNFSFVHLDVDLYQSTLDCLNFFYPRMSRGGAIISHDYPGSKGVKKAIDEFFDDKPEIIIEPGGCGQCLILKV